jgi:imidazolonepropionase-like amidohydrolase
VILKGRAFDGIKLYEKAVVSVDEDQRVINGFGERGSIEERGGAKVVECDGMTIMPGLIDAHVHFYSAIGEGIAAWATVPDTLAVLRAAGDLRTLLNAGFTAVRELGSKGGAHLAQAVEEGVIDGPRVVTCSRALAQTGGDDDPPSFSLEVAQQLASYTYFCDGPWECRRAVRKVARDGAGVVKFYASGAFSRGGKIKRNFTMEEIEAIVDESHALGLKVAAHAYGEEALLSVINGGVDSIEHGLGLTAKTAKMAAEKGIYYIPTLVTYLGSSYPSRAREEAVKRHLKEDMELVKQYGVKVVMGSDIVGDSARPHGRNFEEILEEGERLGNGEALVAATSRAAECLGLRSGMLKEGFDADIIVVKGNPLEDLHALSPDSLVHVMKSGRLYRYGG